MNQKYSQKLLYISLFLIAILVFSCNAVSQNNHSQNSVVRLGNPLAEDGKKGRALNVWDLQVFDNRIYLAGGSTVTNAGPINVWAYNPVTKTFENEYTVDEEAIEHFQVFDNELYIPAADPRHGDANKFYRKTINGEWKKYASEDIKLAHVRDLIKTKSGSLLLVGNNRNPDNQNNDAPGTAKTSDDGISFQGAGINDSPSVGDVVVADYNWFFSVFSYQETIYAPTSLLRDVWTSPGTIAIYDEDLKKFILDTKLDNSEFIPRSQIDINQGKYGLETIYRMWHPVEFNNSLVYPVRSYSNSDKKQQYLGKYMNSIGFYLKEDMGKTPIAIKLPHRALGEDVLIIDDELYILANKQIQPEKFAIYVYKTQEPLRAKWSEVLHFNSTNKARSFEYLDGTFYFGLGQDYGEAISHSGDILSFTSQ